MRERWIRFTAVALCGLGACASTGPSTAPVAPSTATLRHEPVAPPPPPPTVLVAPPLAPPVVVHAPTTQPVPPPPLMATTQPGPVDDRVAYAIGYSAGRRIHDRLDEDGRTADDLLVLKGLIDGLDDRDPAYPQQDVQAAFEEFQAYTLQRRADKKYAENPAFRKQADENLQKSRAVLDQNAEMAGVEVRPDGVQIQLLIPGTGRTVGNAKTLTLKDLRVSLADGTLVKAAEADKTEKLSTTDGLPALMDSVRDIKVGTKCRIWLPADKAYGLTGKPPVVGPNEAIEYEFELGNAE